MTYAEHVALITGAGRGLGREFVTQLAARGVRKVYAGARRTQDLATLTEVYPRQVMPLRLDVTDSGHVGQAAQDCSDVTLLINNAGVNAVQGLLASRDVAAVRTEMETNYFGLLAMCRAFAPVLAANGGGTIVNILSILARVNLPLMGSLCASKAAALSLTQGLRAELASQGTRVIGVLPGAIDTDMSRDFPPPKARAADVVSAVLDALEGAADDIYPDAMAQELAVQLAADPDAVERQFRTMLPE